MCIPYNLILPKQTRTISGFKLFREIYEKNVFQKHWRTKMVVKIKRKCICKIKRFLKSLLDFIVHQGYIAKMTL